MSTETATGGSDANPPLSGGAAAVPQLGLAALFVTALITAQVTASKVLAFDLPVSMPVTEVLVVPGAVFAYAITFFASDCYAELYGRRAAHALVNVAFAMNFVLLALVWLTIGAPAFGGSPVDPEPFRAVLGPSTGVIAGSLLAYVVSQNWDVFVFHWLRDRTDGESLWLRNVLSTATSQAIDTVIFVTVAFLLFQGLPLATVAALALGQYLVKLGIAVVDTPFVYAVVGFVRSRDGGSSSSAVGE